MQEFWKSVFIIHKMGFLVRSRKSEIINPYLGSIHNLWEGSGDQEKGGGGGDPLSTVFLWVTPYKII